jgi:hypothetical protein
MAAKLPENMVGKHLEAAANELVVVGDALEAWDIDAVGLLVKTGLLPALRSLRSEMAYCFNPYILC